MRIKWTSSLLRDLKQTVDFLKTSELGEILERLSLYFTDKHTKYGDINEYYMDFLDPPSDPNSISHGEYRLAFICELVNSKKDKFYNVYKSLSHAINYSLSHFLFFTNYKTDNTVSYIVSILKSICPETESHNLYTCVAAIKLLMKIDIEWSALGGLYTECELIDLSVLPENGRRNILQILETKRTFFLRLLLLLSYWTAREKVDWNHLDMYIHFDNKEKMTRVLKSPPVLISILLVNHQMSIESN